MFKKFKVSLLLTFFVGYTLAVVCWRIDKRLFFANSRHIIVLFVFQLKVCKIDWRSTATSRRLIIPRWITQIWIIPRWIIQKWIIPRWITQIWIIPWWTTHPWTIPVWTTLIWTTPIWITVPWWWITWWRQVYKACSFVSTISGVETPAKWCHFHHWVLIQDVNAICSILRPLIQVHYEGS